VGETVQAFVDNGESRVEAVEQGDGRFTITPGVKDTLTPAAGPSAPRSAVERKKTKSPG
jgi:hypothetical protein